MDQCGEEATIRQIAFEYEDIQKLNDAAQH